MRVTKLIREYVEEEVRKAFPISNEVEEIEKQLKEIDEVIRKENEELKGIIEERVNKIQNKYKIETRKKYYSTALDVCYNPIEYSDYRTTLKERHEKLQNERADKVNKAIKNILIELEMGANKRDLDNMIANLGKEV